MDIWSIIFWASLIYLIWFYSKKRKIKKAIKAAEEEQQRIILEREREKKNEEERKRKEIEEKRVALGLPVDAPKDADINIERICSWEDSDNGAKVLRFTPPFECSAYLSKDYLSSGNTGIIINIKDYGISRYTFDIGVVEVKMSHCLLENDIVAHFYPGAEAVAKRKEEREKELQKRMKEKEEREKAAIARKLKERQRKRDLEKIVTQEMIDSGELFGEQQKRPFIPREVVDAIYRRDGGRCVYCGSTENLQIDHIIPFSKGGSSNIENLQLLCQKCNLEKSNHIG